MGPSDTWEELEEGNFKKKVFRKDKDVVILFYGDQVPSCLAARPALEQVGTLVQKTNENVRTMRIDHMRFGKELFTRHKDLDDFKNGPLPRMYLVRVHEKKPIRFPQEDMMNGMLMAKFLLEHSSFRKDFGFDDYVAQNDHKPQDEVLEDDRVGASKHYKEMLPSDFPKFVDPTKHETFLVHYSDTSKKCKDNWKMFEKAAGMVLSKTKSIKFVRYDTRRHNDMESWKYVPPAISQLTAALTLPHAIWIPQVDDPNATTTKKKKKRRKKAEMPPVTLQVLQADDIDWKGMGAIMKFIINHTKHKEAFGFNEEL